MAARKGGNVMAISHTFIAKDGTKTDDSFTRSKAIRQKCLDFSCWREAEIRKCTSPDCALYPFRMGKVSRSLKISNLSYRGKR